MLLPDLRSSEYFVQTIFKIVRFSERKNCGNENIFEKIAQLLQNRAKNLVLGEHLVDFVGKMQNCFDFYKIKNTDFVAETFKNSVLRLQNPAAGGFGGGPKGIMGNTPCFRRI